MLLPIVVVAIALTGQHDLESGGSFAKMGFGLFILGPGAGIAIGLIAVSALDLIRKRIGVRRDYESLYSLGVAFSAFAAAEAVHGSGFLAAFAAGLTIAALDVELCDCFIEYGGVTAEMLLLFTFVIFGSSLIWTGFSGARYAHRDLCGVCDSDPSSRLSDFTDRLGRRSARPSADRVVWTERTQFIAADPVAGVCRRCRQRPTLPDLRA